MPSLALKVVVERSFFFLAYSKFIMCRSACRCFTVRIFSNAHRFIVVFEPFGLKIQMKLKPNVVDHEISFFSWTKRGFYKMFVACRSYEWNNVRGKCSSWSSGEFQTEEVRLRRFRRFLLQHCKWLVAHFGVAATQQILLLQFLNEIKQRVI